MISATASPDPRHRAGTGKVRKRKWALPALIVIAFVVLAIFLYPLRHGVGICDSVRYEIVQQVPPAMDILALRYPLKVGLLRSALNDQGSFDRVAQQYLRNYLQENQRNHGKLPCYLTYYIVIFNKDRVRLSIANLIEKQFDLK